MKFKTHYRDSQGTLLEVLQELPNRGIKFPTVIMVPGFGVDLHEWGYFDELSDLLVKNGMQTVRFSFAGTGKSGGNFLEMTIDSQVRQFKEILSHTARDRFTKNSRIGVIAQSFGTSTVVAALPQYQKAPLFKAGMNGSLSGDFGTGFRTIKQRSPGQAGESSPLSKIKTFVFTASLAYPEISMAKFFKKGGSYNPDGISEKERSDKSITRIGPNFWKSIANLDLVNKITELTQPVLFIHGRNDQYVKSGEALDYYQAVKSPKKFLIMDRADHGFTGKFRPPLLRSINNWFVEKLC